VEPPPVAGPEEYFELIAIEPGAPGPAQPRWFDLDNFAGPTRATTWICRCDDLDAALAAAPPGTGTPWALERGDLRWRMAVPADGKLPFDGLFPALIEWEGTAHPAPRLPDRGVRLTALELHSPDAERFAQRSRPSSKIRASASRNPTPPACTPSSTRPRARSPFDPSRPPEDAPAIAEIWNRIIRETIITFTTAEKDSDALADTIADGMRPSTWRKRQARSWASSPPSSSVAARATPTRSSIPSTWCLTRRAAASAAR
jgi:hypothetical protein